MKQKDKELVLKEISSRFPYGVKVFSKILNKPTLVKGITDDFIWVYVDEDNYEWEPVEDVKLYLRPLSSMTEEENNERKQLGILCAINSSHERIFDGFGNESVDTQLKAFDWLNAHHFDYHGLIEKGLAIEVTKENNLYEK